MSLADSGPTADGAGASLGEAERRLDLPPNPSGFIETTLESDVVKLRAVQGAGATLVAQGVKFVLKFASAVVLGRLLGPAQFGLVAMVSPILGFVSTLNDLGFAQAVVQRRDITQAQVSGLFWINLVLSVSLAGALMLAAPLVGWMYHEPRTVGVTMVLASLIVVGTLGLVPSALLNRRMRFLPLIAIELATLAVGVAASIGYALAGFGYWALVLGQATSSLTGLCAVWAVARWRPQPPFPRPKVGPLVRFGVNLTGVSLATYFSMTADNIIVGVFNGKIALGLYDRSYTLVLQPLTQLTAPLGRVAVPLLSRVTDAPERFRAIFLRMMRLAILATAPAMICCAMMSKSVIIFLLGSRWAAAAPIFAWISLGGVFAPLFSCCGWAFTSQGRARELMGYTTATALISIAFFGLGAVWGVVGVAAVGAASFILLQTPLMLWGLTRTGAIRAGDLVTTLSTLPLCGAGCVLGVGLIASHPFKGDLFVAAPLAYAVFVGLSLVTPGGRALARGVLDLRRNLPVLRSRAA